MSVVISPYVLIPDGYRLVPIEPDWNMLSADGCSKDHGGQPCIHHDNRRRIWAAMLDAVPAPSIQVLAAEDSQSIDARLKAAGMLTVAELLEGAPLDSFLAHAGVCDIESYAQWVEMKRGEYARSQARYDLGEKEKDDLYEWIVAHSAVFALVHVNLKAALSAAPDQSTAGGSGTWYPAESIDPFVRELDVLINGEKGAAEQARLCDIVAQLRRRFAAMETLLITSKDA
ncbi:hypothetical protein DENIT_20063 [Pseudomonas veronii]|uniref:hypothetical protein n=1 Tax=Pseudomonas veronii TaxID=76761 RepID=UPI00175DF6A9|nr:hypothetical protein [Pseudomonas veronii]CAD0264180.1 hypothetical protein DENIT_20063 [Pseudomonas veronii]